MSGGIRRRSNYAGGEKPHDLWESRVWAGVHAETAWTQDGSHVPYTILLHEVLAQSPCGHWPQHGHERGAGGADECGAAAHGRQVSRDVWRAIGSGVGDCAVGTPAWLPSRDESDAISGTEGGVKRYANKRDATEPDIVQALERVGAKVKRLDAFDLLVLYRNVLFMIDCKSPKGRATMSQERLIAEGWPLRYAETPEEALQAIGAIR